MNKPSKETSDGPVPIRLKRENIDAVQAILNCQKQKLCAKIMLFGLYKTRQEKLGENSGHCVSIEKEEPIRVSGG